MTLFVRSNGKALLPTSHAAQIALEALPRGVPLRVDPKQPRNSKFHRMAWAFATYVAKALNDGPTAKEWTAEDAMTHLKLATGNVETMKLSRKMAGRLRQDFAAVPKSISFAKMDEAAFGKFMDAAMTYVRDDLAPWIEDSEDWPHIVEILRASHMMGDAA